MLNIISPIIPNNKNFEASARALTYFSSRRPKNRPSLICLRLAPVVLFSTLVLSFYISRSTFILKRIIGSNIAIVPQPSKIEENKKNYKTKKTMYDLLLLRLASHQSPLSRCAATASSSSSSSAAGNRSLWATG
jgi:hypothetical protein